MVRARSATGLNNLFAKKWFSAFFIVLIILLVIETSLLVFFVLVSGLARQVFPSIDLSLYLTPGCSLLASTVISTTETNRTVEYSCPNHPAIVMQPPLFDRISPSHIPGSALVLVAPSFTLPTGYISLSVVDNALGCTNKRQTQLRDGQNMTLGGAYVFGYDYCSVIAGPTGHIGGFTITWNEIPWPGACCTLYASPSQLTIQAGHNGTSLVTVTALKAFSGNASFPAYASGGSSETTYTWSINPFTAFLKPGGSNTTKVTVIIPPNAPPDTFKITIIAQPDQGVYSENRVEITIRVT